MTNPTYRELYERIISAITNDLPLLTEISARQRRFSMIVEPTLAQIAKAEMLLPDAATLAAAVAQGGNTTGGSGIAKGS